MKLFAVLTLALLVVALASPALARDTRHSGRVIAVDPGTATVEIEEMKSWTGPDTGLVRLSVRLTPDTALSVLRRAHTPDAAPWPEAWERRPIAPAALKPGDFVTVTTRDSDNVATALDVVQVEALP
jgi:hypothetical protein